MVWIIYNYPLDNLNHLFRELAKPSALAVPSAE